MKNEMKVTSENFPVAYAAMDEAAKKFWKYPDAEWQGEFLRQWARDHDDRELMEALGDN